jgi:large subunit ribosomal protein L1
MSNAYYCVLIFQNRYLDEFTRIVSVPHPFQTDSARSVLVFCKSAELQRSALEAGATIAGATELIKNVQVIKELEDS